LEEVETLFANQSKGGIAMVISRDYFFPGWGRGSILDELGRMQQQMTRLNQSLQPRSGGYTPAGVFPAVNLTENKDGYFIRAELPGVKSEALDIQVAGRNVSVSGERTIASEGSGARYHRREREGGKFSRVIGLPGDIDADQVTARMENGILTVYVPKAETAKPKQISVK
jgi:HSP20 family protein